MTERLGTVLFAPQARLVDVVSGRIIGSNVREVEATDTRPSETYTRISPDLISASVTLVAHGLSQFSVTLNNQRFDNTHSPGRPTFPPWKYNDFSALSTRSGSTRDASGTHNLTFGQRLRLDMRYGDSRWTKMMLGRVTKLDFKFSDDTGGAQVIVTVEDMMSALRAKPTGNGNYGRGNPDTKEGPILRRILGLAGLDLPAEVDPVIDAWPALPPETHQKHTTYYAFLSMLFERLDLELYTDFVEREVAAAARADDAAAIDPSAELRVHLRPCRATVRPATRDDNWIGPHLGTDSYLELRWGKNLIAFKPTFKVAEMPTSVALATARAAGARGRAQAVITEAELTTEIARELWPSPSYREPPVDAVTARREFLADVDDATTNQANASSSSPLDDQRLHRSAAAVIMKELRKFMTVTAKTIGVPKLRPGQHVHVLGMRPPFDGFYYVTQVVHSLTMAGFTSEVTAQRPGMLRPNHYLTLSSEEEAERGTNPPGGTR